jgi:hypothetical protein
MTTTAVPMGPAPSATVVSQPPPSLSHASFPSDPLSIQIIPLRRPEMFFAPALECTEPGDMLHEAVCGTSSSLGCESLLDVDSAVVLPALTYPPRDGGSLTRYLVGETYRGTLVVHNTSPFEIHHVSATVTCVDPRNAKRHLLEFHDKVVGPYMTLEQRMEGYEWNVAGRHSLNVLVYYADSARAAEIRNCPVVIPITVGANMAVSELQAVVVPAHRCPLKLPPGGQPSFEELLATKYRCTALLTNSTNGPLHLTEIVFRKSATTQDDVKIDDLCGIPQMLARDGLWQSKESRRFAFDITLTPPATRNTQPIAMTGATGHDTTKTAAALDIGSMRWGWRRPNGDGGHGTTRPFARQTLVPLASSLLPATDLSPMMMTDVSPSSPIPRFTAIAASNLQVPFIVLRSCITASGPLIVGETATLRFAIANMTTRAIDLVAHVAADRLLPRFLVAGPTIIPVGLLEPKGVLMFMLDAVPLIDGHLVIDASCLELHDVRKAANDSIGTGHGNIVWPSPSADLRGRDPRELVIGEYTSLGGAATARENPW